VSPQALRNRVAEPNLFFWRFCLRSLALIAAAFTVCACSLYQSPGRKFLEKQVFTFSGTSAHFVGFQNSAPLEGWILLSRTPLAQVYGHETGDFETRVVPVESDGQFSCDFTFTSAQEMFELMPSSVEMCVSELHQQQ
jgi:hypothetical protein